MECRGIECSSRCTHRLEFEGGQLFLYICKAEKPCVEGWDHGTCDLWEHIPSSQDPVSKNERLYRAVQGAEKGILNLKYTLGEWYGDPGNRELHDFLLKMELACGHCLHALSDCVDESREFAYEGGIKE